MARRGGMWGRSLGAAALGAAVLMGTVGGAWGQDAKPNAAAVVEASRLNGEAVQRIREGKYDEAIASVNRALAIWEKELGSEHRDVATALNNLGEAYRGKGDYARAEPLYQRALGILEKALGPKHPDVTRPLNSLAVLYQEKGDYARAEPLLQRALGINEKALGPKHPDIAQSLNNLAVLYQEKGDYARGEPLLQRAIGINEKALGPEHPEVAILVYNLAHLYRTKGDYARAESLFQRVLGIREKALGPNHPDVAQAVNSLALLYQTKGDYARAEPLFLRALGIFEKALGPEHPDVGLPLQNLAGVYGTKGDYARAEPLYQRALGIMEKALGPEHPHVAMLLNNLARLYRLKGDYVRAEGLHQRVLGIREKALGPAHPEVGEALTDLANIYHTKGDDARAEPLMLRALGIIEKALGPEHPSVATALNNLAVLYRTKGDYARAMPLYQRALAMTTKTLGPDHPEVATSLMNVANVYLKTGDDAQAEQLYQRALRISEKTLGPAHPNVGLVLSNLAHYYLLKGDDVRGEPLCQRALGIQEKALGPDHPEVGQSLVNLAEFYRRKGDHERAKELYQRALGIFETRLGREHPIVASVLGSLAWLHFARNDARSAVREKERAQSIEDRNAVRELAVGTDEQRLAYMREHRAPTFGVVSLHVQSATHVEGAKELALRTILRSKGLVLDAMSNSFATLRDRLTPADQRKFDEWRSLNAQYSALAQHGPEGRGLDDHRNALKALDDERQKIENELSFVSKDLTAQLRPVTIAEVQAAIPEGAALVELFGYLPFNPQSVRIEDRWGKARYVAYVLHHTGDPTFADLGEAAPIEDAVKALRKTLSRASTDPKPAAKDLYRRVMAPIQNLLGKTRHVYVSPDGVLNLVPFGAMMTEDGHYLVETHSITYLPSGRELVRSTNPVPSRSGAFVFAGPDYEAFDDAKMRVPRQFTPLRYAAKEARSIATKLEGVKTLEGTAATEGAIKALLAPRILHISTHGFFDRDQEALHGTPDKEPLPIENALLHSGLAFAGANRGGVGKEDGLLTALEASQLDLWGTQLVVLSACETGMGQAANGDGVYGLRRAFTMAGAETVVMSLWQVDAAATTNLMNAYYEGLSAGGGRAEALRQAQLAMLSSKDRPHPHYWASFIVSGDDRSMEGQMVNPSFSRVNPGPRGCACETAGAPDGNEELAGAFALALGAGIAARRRKGAVA